MTGFGEQPARCRGCRPAAGCRCCVLKAPTGAAAGCSTALVHMSDLEAGEQPASRHAPAQSPGQHGGSSSSSSNAQQQAAQLIQKNYRGYRERRQLQGMGLDAGARWSEVRPSFVRNSLMRCAADGNRP